MSMGEQWQKIKNFIGIRTMTVMIMMMSMNMKMMRTMQRTCHQ